MAFLVIVETDGWFAAVTMVGGCCAGLGGQMLTISGAVSPCARCSPTAAPEPAGAISCGRGRC